MPQPSRPPFDPELEAVLALMNTEVPTITLDVLPAMRAAGNAVEPVEEMLDDAGVTRRDLTIPGYEGAGIRAAVFARADHAEPGPGFLQLHGGGMIMGDPTTGLAHFLPLIVEHDAVVVALEYRLAPEYPDPYPVEDCYAGLLWTADHAAELGIDPGRLAISGASAGGGLAAGTALLARDRKGPGLLGQILIYPMIDDRDQTVSTLQYESAGLWNRESNLTGWNALLGDRRGTDDVSVYAAPARASDLSGLPPAYIECGSSELFRDEDVAYATALWHCGGEAELHVWPGGFHGFDIIAAHTALARRMAKARDAWVARLLDN